MDINMIKELMKALEESDLSSLEVKDESVKIKIKKHADCVQSTVSAMPAVAQAVTSAMPAAPSLTSSSKAEESAAKIPADTEVISAPLVGTVYRAKDVDSEPFIDVGTEVKAGDPLCLIEAMKMFSEIKAPCDGVVSAVLFENEQLCEYGQDLVHIKKK